MVHSMLRPLLAPLLIVLLSVAVEAQAAGSPARQSADGGGCPSAQQPAGDEEAVAATGPAVDGAADAGGIGAERPRPRAISGADRGRVRLRWHSFVPGMFK